jgi:hypothetical protein
MGGACAAGGLSHMVWGEGGGPAMSAMFCCFAAMPCPLSHACMSSFPVLFTHSLMRSVRLGIMGLDIQPHSPIGGGDEQELHGD